MSVVRGYEQAIGYEHYFEVKFIETIAPLFCSLIFLATIGVKIPKKKKESAFLFLLRALSKR